MPESVCAAIRAHHRVETAPAEHRQTALLVHLADALCYHVGMAEMGEGVVLWPDDPALVEFGIDPDALAALAEDVAVEVERAIDLLGSYRG
jgi:hypothetical protein